MTTKTLNLALKWPKGATVLYEGKTAKGTILETRRTGLADADALVSWKDVLLPQTNWVDIRLLHVIDQPRVVVPQDVAHTPVYWS